METDESRIARDIVSILVQKDIKLLALDFDKTLINIHTCGYWRGGSTTLAEHIRKCFVCLIKAAMESKLQVCIVTYSMQPDLIRDVLRLVLDKSDANKILIRANSSDWGTGGTMLGKQQHIAWCVTELYDRHHMIIKPHQILLIDDDSENVRTAVRFGHHGFEVPEDINSKQLLKFVQGIRRSSNN